MKDNRLPKISIVTICYQAKNNIEKTILSVIGQSYKFKEYIIVDGGSTDGTLEIIKKYASYISLWISEKDRGIYHAMNKGISFANGEWICFMNSGDTFISSDILDKIFTSVNIEDVDIIYGDVVLDYEDFKVVKNSCYKIDSLWKGMIFSHQSSFTKTSLARTLLFNENYKIAADFDFFYRAYMRGTNFLYLPFPISIISPGGLSDEKQILSVLERRKIVIKKSLCKKEKIKIKFYYFKKLFISFVIIMLKKFIPNKLWRKLIFLVGKIRGKL